MYREVTTVASLFFVKKLCLSFYKNNMNKILLFLFFNLFLLGNLLAQLDLTPDFQTKLAETGVHFLTPVEHHFKVSKVYENQLQPYDFAIRQKKDKVEIRYLVLPDTGVIAGGYTHMNFSNRTMTLASNEDDEAVSTISVIQLTEKTLKEKYHADWGAISFFTPKKSFSNSRYCKLVGLYCEGRGYVYTFFLYDNVNVDFNAGYDLLEFEEVEKLTE